MLQSGFLVDLAHSAKAYAGLLQEIRKSPTLTQGRTAQRTAQRTASPSDTIQSCHVCHSLAPFYASWTGRFIFISRRFRLPFKSLSIQVFLFWSLLFLFSFSSRVQNSFFFFSAHSISSKFFLFSALSFFFILFCFGLFVLAKSQVTSPGSHLYLLY